MKTTQIKVTKNIYGNYRIRVTGDAFAELIGSNDFDAISAASKKLDQHDGSVISPLSVVSMQDVVNYRASLARHARK